MIADLMEGNQAKIITLFAISPGSAYTRKELKEKTILNNMPLDNALASLLNNKIIRKEKRFFRFNHENGQGKGLLAIAQKEYISFKEIPLKVYYAIAEFSALASRLPFLVEARLFGSYSKLVYTEKSDIDIAIFSSSKEERIKRLILAKTRKLEKKYGKTIEIHYFHEKDLNEKDPLIGEIKKNGVPLW